MNYLNANIQFYITFTKYGEILEKISTQIDPFKYNNTSNIAFAYLELMVHFVQFYYKLYDNIWNNDL